MKKIILNLCPTGMVPTKKLNRYVPISPKEIIKDTVKCAKLGASIVHLHARGKDGKPTWKKEIYREIITGIRKQNKDLIICVSTSGRSWSEFEKRSEVLELTGRAKPDMASLTVGSMNFINTASVNNPDMIKKLALKMKRNGIKPELEVFEPGMIHKAKYLMKKGIINKTKPYFNILLGSLGTSPLDVSSVASFLSLLPKDAIWNLTGVGAYQLDAEVLALALGGNLRVGLEDNIFYDRKKEKLATNKSLLKRIIKIIELMNLEIATPREARAMLGLK